MTREQVIARIHAVCRRGGWTPSRIASATDQELYKVARDDWDRLRREAPLADDYTDQEEYDTPEGAEWRARLKRAAATERAARELLR